MSSEMMDWYDIPLKQTPLKIGPNDPENVTFEWRYMQRWIFVSEVGNGHQVCDNQATDADSLELSTCDRV